MRICVIGFGGAKGRKMATKIKKFCQANFSFRVLQKTEISFLYSIDFDRVIKVEVQEQDENLSAQTLKTYICSMVDNTAVTEEHHIHVIFPRVKNNPKTKVKNMSGKKDFSGIQALADIREVI